MQGIREQIENERKLEKEMEGKYLTEEYLGKFLNVAYPERVWVHDEKFKLPLAEKAFNFRPDYCCHELKMCVEFDGPDHFTKANIIQSDIKKDKILTELGYTVVRIPYFVQLDYFSIQHFFGIDLSFCNNFNHGFVSKNAVLPSSFCEQGIWKFKELVTAFDMYKETGHIFDQIRESLMTKVDKLAKNLHYERALFNVIPSTLTNCLRTRGYSKALLENHTVAEKSINSNHAYIILESSQIIRDTAQVVDMTYIYNSEGYVSGYSFGLLSSTGIGLYNVIVKNNTLVVNVYKSDKFLYNQEKELLNTNIQELVDFIFHI